MNPQIYGVLMDRLMDAGALDVFYAPIQMKKNRPGTLVTVVSSPDKRESLVGLLFAESTTIGLRITETSRECLDRDIVRAEPGWFNTGESGSSSRRDSKCVAGV